MNRRAWIPAVLAALVLAAGCATPSGERAGSQQKLLKEMNVSTHDCLSYWGPTADLLLPLMNAQRADHGRGWACRLQGTDGAAVHSAIVGLKDSLFIALDQGRAQCMPKPKDLPAPGSVGPLALQLQDLLNADRYSGFHPDPDLDGWLLRPVTTPERPAIPRAREILAAVKEALDM